LKQFEREEQNMVTDNTSLGTSRNNVILGSGLSGMVAAYISARAQEDHAFQKEDWQAIQAFRPKRVKQRNRKIHPDAAGATLSP
jgi:hypothetical protein